MSGTIGFDGFTSFWIISRIRGPLTRLASLPKPYVEDRVPTAREVEIQGIRARLSLCAAMLTQKRERIEATIIAIERELERLKEVR